MKNYVSQGGVVQSDYSPPDLESENSICTSCLVIAMPIDQELRSCFVWEDDLTDLAQMLQEGTLEQQEYSIAVHVLEIASSVAFPS